MLSPILMAAAVGADKRLCMNSPFHSHRCLLRSFLPGGRGNPFPSVAKAFPRGLCRGQTAMRRTISNHQSCPVVCLPLTHQFNKCLLSVCHVPVTPEFMGNSGTSVEDVAVPGTRRRGGASATVPGRRGPWAARVEEFSPEEERQCVSEGWDMKGRRERAGGQ